MSSVTIRVRPRWKRLRHVPRLVLSYRRLGLSWRHAIRLAWAMLFWKPVIKSRRPA